MAVTKSLAFNSFSRGRLSSVSLLCSCVIFDENGMFSSVLTHFAHNPRWFLPEVLMTFRPFFQHTFRLRFPLLCFFESFLFTYVYKIHVFSINRSMFDRFRIFPFVKLLRRSRVIVYNFFCSLIFFRQYENLFCTLFVASCARNCINVMGKLKAFSLQFSCAIYFSIQFCHIKVHFRLR